MHASKVSAFIANPNGNKFIKGRGIGQNSQGCCFGPRQVVGMVKSGVILKIPVFNDRTHRIGKKLSRENHVISGQEQQYSGPEQNPLIFLCWKSGSHGKFSRIFMLFSLLLS